MPIVEIVRALPEAAAAAEFFFVVKEVGVVMSLYKARQYSNSNWG